MWLDGVVSLSSLSISIKSYISPSRLFSVTIPSFPPSLPHVSIREEKHAFCPCPCPYISAILQFAPVPHAKRRESQQGFASVHKCSHRISALWQSVILPSRRLRSILDPPPPLPGTSASFIPCLGVYLFIEKTFIDGSSELNTPTERQINKNI